ncbi:MAG: btuB 2 [Lacunisphaera sp.]|nr:btuB 2 [Lacunisphaera sp.]
MPAGWAQSGRQGRPPLRRPIPLKALTSCFRSCWLSVAILLPLSTIAAPVDFNLPAAPVAETLLAFSKQARIEVLFSFDDLSRVTSTAVAGRYEPEDALAHLLRDTGYAARRNRTGKFTVTANLPPVGAIRGRLLAPKGGPAASVQVALAGTRRSTVTNGEGEFEFPAVMPGTHHLQATGAGYRPLQITNLEVRSGRTLSLETYTMQPAEDLIRLEPYVVRGKASGWGADRDSLPPPPTAAGNLDLHRTANDALPFTVFTRDEITRSGVVDLNEFLQRELLDSDTSTRPPEQNGSVDSFVAGSSNLKLRGFDAEETIVLVNGRRLPEIPTAVGRGATPPDVNFIPLSLVKRIEVLPVSASAVYSGNAVGGVINIVLRTDVDATATELTTTYTNATGGFDAPQISASLQHAQRLLEGRLRYQLSATYTRAVPPTEAELGYRQARTLVTTQPGDILYRATPNVRSADDTPLFATGTATVTSVAPGANGAGGLVAFASRQGVRSLDLFRSPGGLATSPDSFDYPYGRRQQRTAYFGSVVCDVFPWLELGVDGTYSSTVVNRGFNVFTADLALAGTSPLNPFGQDVNVSLNETAPALGENYSEARIEFSSAVLGLLLKLPADWRVSFDAQFAHNVTKYRGLAPADNDRWQQLVAAGSYNPLRDTQVFGPPAAFYDRVLVYYGGPGKFVTLGDYHTIDAAVRISNAALPLPTGLGVLNAGVDYRRNQLGGYTEQLAYADGSLAHTPNVWLGRTIQRFSFFGELQAPLLPVRALPAWLHNVEADLAARYVAADTAAEANLAPAGGLKLDLAGGWAVRASYSQANRFPNPHLSKLFAAPGPGGGVSTDTTDIFDPRRDQQHYGVQVSDEVNPNLRTEASATTTFGVILTRGKIHHLRAALDFTDTQKANELVALDKAQDVLNLESFYPLRVTRAPLAPGDAHGAGLVTSVLTGVVNVASRHSQNWNGSLDYAEHEFLGGTLELYARGIYFSRYERQALPGSPTVDELRLPDGFASGVMKFRANFGASWSNHDFGFGLDGHYFHSRLLPEDQRQLQGDQQIKPYWQFDAYVQTDLGRWLPWKSRHYDLHAQLRVNNVPGSNYPKYVYEGSGSRVQPYGDWRGRTYSLSLTATF